MTKRAARGIAPNGEPEVPAGDVGPPSRDRGAEAGAVVMSAGSGVAGEVDVLALRSHIGELEEALGAIRRGGVDAVLVGEPGSERVYALANAERPYKTIVENMSEGALTVSARRIVLFANHRFAEMSGRDPTEIVGRPVAAFFGPECSSDIDVLLAVSPGQQLRSDLELVTAHGPLPISLSASCIDIEGALVRCLVATDLTSQKEAERALEAMVAARTSELEAANVVLSDTNRTLGVSAAMLADSQRIVGLGSWVDLVGRETTWSLEQHRLLGYTPGQVVPSRQAFLARVHPEDVARAGAAMEGVDKGGEFRVTSGGEERWVSVRATPVIDVDGQVLGTHGTCQDITERRRTEERLVDEALHDRLTGLPNRAMLADLVQLALGRVQREDSKLALMFVDVDRFKLINDGRGHAVGDAVLEEVARRLVGAVRPGDVVARFGGDEFVVVCERVDGVDGAAAIAARLGRTFEPAMSVPDAELRVTVSIGVAIAGRAETIDSLLTAADAAMYEAKSQGRGHFAFADAAMRQRAQTRLTTESDLAGALAAGQFRVVYQPIISLKSAHITGFEALVRWEHPERGVISPVEFIPLAEEMGVIGALGTWVLGQACRQLALWHADDPSLSMAVNLSPYQLLDQRLADDVAGALTGSGIPPGLLTLELTESALVADDEATISAVARLQNLGVHIAMDDFGTGYSSLSYLSRLPIDLVKIDRSLVAGAPSSPRTSRLIEEVVSMFHGIGLAVVVEGVETPEEARLMSSIGCELAQGYLFARPAAAEVLGDLTSLRRQVRRSIGACAVAESAEEAPRRSTVVIVEDDPASRHLTTYLLSLKPALRVVAAANGAEFKAVCRRERPDLVLMDMRLPDSSGEELVRAFRWAGGPTPRFVAVTSYPEQVPTGSGAFDGVIPKPVSPADFANQVEAYLADKTPAT